MAPKRRSITYSQNFLKSRKLARRLASRSSLGPDDTVLEVGPGRGVLTRPLAERCHQVIAVEKDPALASSLSVEIAGLHNVVIYEADFLDVPLPSTPYNVFANIPFNVTAAIVTRLTQATNPPDETYLVVQREAAERFAGGQRESLVSLLLKPWFAPSIVHRFASDDFVPPPRDDVVLLRFNKRGPPLVPLTEAQRYRDFVVFGFTAWQPNVRYAYRTIFDRQEFDELCGRLGLDPRLKPSEVPFPQWLGLYEYFREHSSPRARNEVEGAEQRLRKQQTGLRKEYRTRKKRRR